MGERSKPARQQGKQTDRRRRQPPYGGYHHKVWNAKRAIILTALVTANGSFADAAKALKVNRTYLHRLVNQLDLREAAARLSQSDLDPASRMALPSSPPRRSG